MDTATGMAEVTPIILLIGFSPPGMATLFSHLLRQPEPAGIAVVTAPPDPPMRWGGGCICCAPRDDVARALRALLPSVRRDETQRIVIEMTGLADPGPILATLLSDTVAASAYRLDGIVAVVDAAKGGGALDTSDRAIQQIALADRIVLTGTGGADPNFLRRRLQRLNPNASIVIATDGAVHPGVLLGAGLSSAPRAAPDLHGWIDTEAVGGANQADTGGAPEPPTSPKGAAASLWADDTHVRSFCLSASRKLPWPAVLAWLERLVLLHGDSLLRMKAILNLQGKEQPVAIHSARHLLFPSVPLPAWPSGDPRDSRFLFVTRDLPSETVTAGFAAIASAMAEVE